MAHNREDVVVLTREELFDRVWTTALRNLAPSLGISDVGLKKICRRFNIPTPPVGYWAKREHGKSVRRPRLPRYDDPDLQGIKFFPNDEIREESKAEAQAKLELATGCRIAIPEDLNDAHQLVLATEKSLRAASPRADGLVEPRAKRTIDVCVSPPLIDRALRIMDGLIKALSDRNLLVRLTPQVDTLATTVSIEGEVISFGLYEVVNRQEREPTPAERDEIERWFLNPNKKFYKDVATGKLCLAINSGPSNGRRRRFTDTNRRPVENLLNAFIATLFRTAQDIKEERSKHELLAREREDAERRRREREQDRIRKIEEIREEEEQMARLEAEVAAWTKSQAIRAYIEAIRQRLIQREGRLPTEGKAAEWLEWATRQADRFDPLCKSPHSVLDEKRELDCSPY